MLTINKLIPQGRGLAAVLVRRGSTLELGWDTRQKSHFHATDSAGRALDVSLASGTVVRGGDVLVAEDGSFVLVKAAPQPLLVVRHCSAHGAPHDLVRAAYLLGGRHVPLEVKPDHLKLAPDASVAELLRRQHLIVSEANEPFEPEASGDAGHPGHGHHHGHDHDHGHDHSHHHSHHHSHDDHHGHGHHGHRHHDN